MKNFKKFTAFVLALCMLFSLSVAAFAAEADEHTIYDSAPDEETAISTEAATSGTIQNSGRRIAQRTSTGYFSFMAEYGRKNSSNHFLRRRVESEARLPPASSALVRRYASDTSAR